MTLQKKVVLVTGASSEIGSAVVKGLLATEYHVVAQVHSNPKALDALAGSENLSVVPWGLSDANRAQCLIDQVIADHGRLDGLVHTIGPLLLKNIDQVSPMEWDEQMHLNLNLAFYLAQAAKTHLIASKGHLVNFTFSGVDLLKARMDSTAYCAAKAGLLILTKTFASLLAPQGVRVNAISPGLIEASQATLEERIEMAKEIPLGRPGAPSEISEVLNWILTKSPEYMTGAQIPVSGAWEYL